MSPEVPEESRPEDGRDKGRFPRSVYSEGDEPDPRFSLANERTFLAWLRTALALIAGGAALEALGFPESEGFRAAAAMVFITLGVAAAIRAWFGWMATERALRHNKALPSPGLGVVLVTGIVIGVVLVVLGVVL